MRSRSGVVYALRRAVHVVGAQRHPASHCHRRYALQRPVDKVRPCCCVLFGPNSVLRDLDGSVPHGGRVPAPLYPPAISRRDLEPSRGGLATEAFFDRLLRYKGFELTTEWSREVTLHQRSTREARGSGDAPRPGRNGPPSIARIVERTSPLVRSPEPCPRVRPGLGRRAGAGCRSYASGPCHTARRG